PLLQRLGSSSSVTRYKDNYGDTTSDTERALSSAVESPLQSLATSLSLRGSQRTSMPRLCGSPVFRLYYAIMPMGPV
ncbi:hypothetical protein SCLCIDRAFT_1142458, partial [Scleroderma citrinum Foug A]